MIDSIQKYINLTIKTNSKSCLKRQFSCLIAQFYDSQEKPIKFSQQLFYNFIMIKPKSRTKSSLPVFAQNQISETLEPIYSKVSILKRELQVLNSQKKQAQTLTNFFTKTWKQQFLEVDVDRDLEIEKERKLHKSQSLSIKNVSNNKKSQLTKTSTNWQDHKRNNAKSLINFLVNNKSVKKNQPKTDTKNCPSKQQNDRILAERAKFEPLGQEYKKQKLFQQSIKSESQSLSASRNDQSSLRSSTALGVRKQNSSKKYLRKGTRVRQILMRQLQTPDERGSSASSLTYLKDYDQWVPSALVQEKKAELQSFMNIIYGNKRAAQVEAVDLDKIELIYL